MNSQDKSSFPGLDALRSQAAPAELQSKILSALQPERRPNKKLKVLSLSVATVVVALIATTLLTPRVASAVAKVLRALQTVGRYHVKSFQINDGKRQLMSETWIDGAKRKFIAYGPDGKPLPDELGIGDATAKLDKAMRGMTPKDLVDPATKEKLNEIVGSHGSNSGGITERITVDGKEVSLSDLPEGVKDQIKNMMPTDGMKFPIGGEDDITYLRGMLKDPSRWTITPNQRMNGKTLDKYEVKGAEDTIAIFVDPATYLPISLQRKTAFFGQTVTITDELDYPSSGP